MMQPLPKPIPGPLAELIAGRLRVLAQPIRVRLIDELMAGTRTVREIADALGTTQQNISHHLGLLHQAGILTRRREGTRVRYELSDPFVIELFERAASSVSRQLGELTKRIGPDHAPH
jgi:DNA-binding transcriptional ArsR family regulator